MATKSFARQVLDELADPYGRKRRELAAARRAGYETAEREAALLMAAIITQTGPVAIPYRALAEAEPGRLRITRDVDGATVVSLADTPREDR